MTAYKLALKGLALTMFLGGIAPAHAAAPSPLMQLGVRELRAELDRRYNDAVQAAQASETLRADSARYIWANEAKAQCGIAIGFTKAGKKDEPSVSKCGAFAARLAAPVAAPSAPVAAPVVAQCEASPIMELFFNWDEDVPPADASALLAPFVQARPNCGWTSFTVTGHTDTSGPNVYNDGLSLRRANNVAAVLQSLGLSAGEMTISGTGEAGLKIETADGVREPANRRVEIIAVQPGK
jgi:outer membrane protein OmpA-like peptidoglycan-associated protein